MIEIMMSLYQVWREASLYTQMYFLALVFSAPLICLLMGIVERITRKRKARK